jgi:hypothetical protein
MSFWVFDMVNSPVGVLLGSAASHSERVCRQAAFHELESLVAERLKWPG